MRATIRPTKADRTTNCKRIVNYCTLTIFLNSVTIRIVANIEVFDRKNNVTNQVISETSLSQKASEVFSKFAAELGRYSAAELLRLMQREELSMPRAVALMYLAREGAMSISDISTYLNLSLGNT